jgi:hypothetical protein
MKKTLEKEHTFEELTELVRERDEDVCHNCGDIIVNPWLIQINNIFNYYHPDDYMLVCGRCKQKAAKNLMKNELFDDYDK